MENNYPEITREEALKKVANVIEEALDEFDLLSKMDFEMVQDPTRAEEEHKDEDKEEVEKADDEMRAAVEADEDKDEDKKDDKKDESEKEESDEDVKKSYESALGKMKARGLVKSEAPATAKSEEVKVEAKKEDTITKSESPKTDQTEVLAKAYDARFEALTKTVSDMSETIKKLSSAPVARKGLSGLAPLRKSEDEGKNLSKSETIEKLFDLQKSGNRQVDPSLINRVETGRVTTADLEFINKMLG